MRSPKQLNRNLFVALIIVFLATACAGKTFPPESPEYVVHSLYQDSAKDGIPKDPAKLSQYFDGRLAELLTKDFTCIRNGEPCGLLYFDPVSQSKDPDINDLEIFNPGSGTEIFVVFMQREISYKAVCVMTKTPAGWRISDIIYYGANDIMEAGASLLTALALQQKPPAPWHPPVQGMPEEF